MASSLTTESWSDVTSTMIDDVTQNKTLGEDVMRELTFWIPPIAFLLGLFGNSLCMAAICSSGNLIAAQTKVYFAFLLLMCDVHLTAAALYWLPTSFVTYIRDGGVSFLQTSILTDLGCQLLSYFRSASLFVVAWLLVAQTAERYAALSRPLKTRKNPKKTALFVSFIIIAIGFGVEATKFFGVVAIRTNNGTETESLSCGLNDLGQVVKMVDVLIIYLLSPIFLFVLALCLSCMVNLHNSFKKKWRYQKPFPDNHQSGLPLVMAFVYSLGLIPFFVWSVLFLISMIWGEDSIIDVIARYAEEGATLLVLLLSGLNVLYLIIAGGNYRYVICRIICPCCTRNNDELPSEQESMRAQSLSNGGGGGGRDTVHDKEQQTKVKSDDLGQINMVFNDSDTMTQL